MTEFALTRRALARIAVLGTAGILLPSLPIEAQDAAPVMPNEGAALAQAVALSVGYGLTDTQTHEVTNALKDYPGTFAKARAYAIPDDVEPAWTPDTPPVPPRKGRGR